MWSLFLSLLLASGVSSPVTVDVHDFHVSRLTANYIPEEGRIECTLMTFVDDVEAVLTEHHQLHEAGASNSKRPTLENLNLTEPDEHPMVDSLITSYLESVLHFSNSSSDLSLPVSYIGKERDEDPYGMFIYFYIDSIPVARDATKPTSAKLALESNYMLELYRDQQNVVVWKLNGESADYDLLTYDTRSCDFEP